MKYLIDSYAWIEYLDGSLAGEKVRKILTEENEIYSLSLIISEVISRTKRKGGNVETAYRAILSNSKIISVSPEIAKDSGLFHAQMKDKIRDFGLVDSFVFVIAKKLNAKILTGDEHFRGFKEAVMIK